MKKVHVIGIGGIGISAVARYYAQLGSTITGSDGSTSTLIDTLRQEGMTIYIGHRAEQLPDDTDLVVYSEAIITKPDLSKEENLNANPELAKAHRLGIRSLSYPEALAEIVNAKRCIAVTGSHGKSTTTAMIGTMLMDSSIGGSTIVGTQVPQFGGSNIHVDPKSPWFAIEACEYKRSFLRYHPTITVITNIDLDHLDYYHDEEDYRSAFESILSQTSETVVLNGDCIESQKLTQLPPKTYVVYHDYYVDNTGTKHPFPKLQLQVPGEHLAFDAKLAFVVGIIVGLDEREIIEKLEAYRGAWRRSEIVGTTTGGNILMSDYGHHPSEIQPTLRAIKEKHPDKELLVAFQPHQYSRTRELLEDFAVSFDAADELIIPNIYFSRDRAEDVAWMTPEKFVERLQQRYPKTVYGNGLSNTLKFLQSKDIANPSKLIILLLGAGNIDELRKELIPIK